LADVSRRKSNVSGRLKEETREAKRCEEKAALDVVKMMGLRKQKQSEIQ